MFSSINLNRYHMEDIFWDFSLTYIDILIILEVRYFCLNFDIESFCNGLNYSASLPQIFHRIQYVISYTIASFKNIPQDHLGSSRLTLPAFRMHIEAEWFLKSGCPPWCIGSAHDRSSDWLPVPTLYCCMFIISTHLLRNEVITT